MHLPRKSNAGNVFRFCARLSKRLLDRRAASAPPIEWILLRPAVLRRSKRGVFVSAACRDMSSLVNQQRACTARPNVNSKKKSNGRPPENKFERELY
jgi:hypothetical protein